MKKVIYIHQYFRTPEEGGAIRSFYISQALHNEGYQVEIITAHNYKEYELKLVHGLKIHYLPVAYDNKYGFFKRILAFIKFVYQAKERLKKIKNADLCYITSTPLTVGIVGIWALKKMALPYVFEVRDLWPEAPIQMGALKSRFARMVARKLEANIYNHAAKIVSLSPGISDDIRSRFPKLDMVEIPNMSDTSYFTPTFRKDETLVKSYGVGGKFVISYFGAIGKVNHLEYLIQAAELFQKWSIDVIFLIAGEGSQKKRLVRMVKDSDLNNVKFLGHLDRQGITGLLNITDAAYISFADYPVLETNSPNKFFDALAAGKMIITNTKGWVRRLIEEYDCGFYYNPYMPEEFVSKILSIIQNPALLLPYQKNARQLAVDKFDKNHLTQKLIKALFADKASERPMEKAYISNH